MGIGLDLPTLLIAVIAFGIFVYGTLNGFELGVGLLFPFFRGDCDRQLMMNTLAPIWGGNETWLVLCGAALFAAFPVAYATLLPAGYLPLVLMLCGLIFRGVAFKLRAKFNRTRFLCDAAFCGGSALATLAQGMVLGILLQGTPAIEQHYAGDDWDWLSPFSLFCGIGLLVAYAALGCAWLIMKTRGPLQQGMFIAMRLLTPALLAMIGIVSLWTVIGQAEVRARWLDPHNLPYFLLMPLLVLGCVIGILRAVERRRECAPFLFAMSLMLLAYSGLIISIFPNIVSPDVGLWNAPSAHCSQVLALIKTAIILPFVVAYTALNYWVFLGKDRHDDRRR
ncbi:cytochrome d ubiquinol oxidase subunit II [Lysobacter gummosus]|uniref:Cytochrome d ubiquinol oxidase subunit II n=1 Tax=Lysobacter gummosus TaxID=262324 RepID=A0ABY3XKS7_9GAMM|nr:cytochrome d ubiquinol oxidase subunit II [Lysobacter gummosus]UNP32209.1 cytochrome d ubiquinol oxidase subunit II [Lysobacter gummosus]